MSLPDIAGQRFILRIILRQTVSVVWVKQRCGGIGIRRIWLVFHNEPLEVGVVVAVWARRQSIPILPFVVELPLAQTVEKWSFPYSVEGSAPRVSILDVHWRIRQKYAWADCAIPVNVKITAIAVSSG